MNTEQLIKFKSRVFSRVAECIGSPPWDLSIFRPCEYEGELRGTVYWGSMYVCEAAVESDGTVVLHSWRPLWADRGRLEYTPQHYDQEVSCNRFDDYPDDYPKDPCGGCDSADDCNASFADECERLNRR